MTPVASVASLKPKSLMPIKYLNIGWYEGSNKRVLSADLIIQSEDNLFVCLIFKHLAEHDYAFEGKNVGILMIMR